MIEIWKSPVEDLVVDDTAVRSEENFWSVVMTFGILLALGGMVVLDFYLPVFVVTPLIKSIALWATVAGFVLWPAGFLGMRFLPLSEGLRQ